MIDWPSAPCYNNPTAHRIMFYQNGETRVFNDMAEEKAKAICGLCPITTECLDYALDTDQEYGVWGGTTQRERRAIARRKSA